MVRSLVIGLFGLVGMLGVALAPFIGRAIDKLIPWYATIVACFALLVFQAIQTGAGGINIAAVVIACFGIDVFRQMQQVSLTSAVFELETRARARLNAILIISVRKHCSRFGWQVLTLGGFSAFHRTSHGYISRNSGVH